MTHILIADDDPVQCRILEALVRRFGYTAESVAGGEAALKRIYDAAQSSVDLLILDLVMPDLDGMGVLGQLRSRQIALPVIVETSPGSIEAVTSAMRAGATDFVVKPVGAERIQISIKNALRLGRLEDEFRRVTRNAAGTPAFADFVAQSEDMNRVIRLAERAAKSHVPVLIEGEPGTGKDHLARAIQAASERRARAFITINCATLEEAESEALLFGTDKSPGKLSETQGGTLVLNEISALSSGLQMKLLRLLQDGEFESAHMKRLMKSEVRLIATTSRNLIERVKTGHFREDLYYRLHVLPVTIPPLRNRREDIPLLAARFAARFAAEEGKPHCRLDAEALRLLTAYPWPGNTRQLENAVFRAVVLAEGEELSAAEFPQIAARVAGHEVQIPPAPSFSTIRADHAREIVRIEMRDPNVLKLLNEHGDMLPLEALEAETIRFALAHYRGQMSEISRKLGIGRSTLYRKMKEHGFQEAESSVDAA